MNQTDIKKNQKKIPWVIYLIIFAVFTIVLSVIIKLLTPPEAEIPETNFVSNNLDQSKSQITNLAYTGEIITLPDKLPIVQIQEKKDIINNIQQQLIEEYALTQSETNPNLWKGQDYFLSYDLYNNHYILNINEIPLDKKAIIDLDTALAISDNFISKNFPNLEISPMYSQIDYLESGYQLNKTTQSNANLIRIPYSYTINKLPVFIGQKSYYPFIFLVNADAQVQKLTFQPYFYNFTIISKNKTINLEKALENINNSQASIIYVDQNQEGAIDLSQIQSGVLNKVSTEYRLDSQAGLAYPFYHFEGTVLNDQNIELFIELITPAVNVIKPAD